MHSNLDAECQHEPALAPGCRQHARIDAIDVSGASQRDPNEIAPADRVIDSLSRLIDRHDTTVDQAEQIPGSPFNYDRCLDRPRRVVKKEISDPMP